MGGLHQPYERDQGFLLPPSPRDWLPKDHLVYFLIDVVDQLDLSRIEKRYREAGSGNVSYHPRLMVTLLVYAYATGVFSSRKIARAIEENVAFRVIAAGQQPRSDGRRGWGQRGRQASSRARRRGVSLGGGLRSARRPIRNPRRI